MTQKILIHSVITLLLFTACASNNGANYDGNSYKQIKTSEKQIRNINLRNKLNKRCIN